jgi:hypothetical protein
MSCFGKRRFSEIRRKHHAHNTKAARLWPLSTCLLDKYSSERNLIHVGGGGGGLLRTNWRFTSNYSFFQGKHKRLIQTSIGPKWASNPARIRLPRSTMDDQSTLTVMCYLVTFMIFWICQIFYNYNCRKSESVNVQACEWMICKASTLDNINKKKSWKNIFFTDG